MPRGGSRNPRPGGQYPNRTDLSAGSRPLPVQTATGQPYGAAKAQADAQKIVPMGGTPMPAPTPAATAAAPATSYLGDHGDPLRPTDRPNEPVTAGLAVGAGPGPEMLPSTPASAQTVGQFLQALAARPGAPSDIVALAALAQSRG